jgi:mitotic spindle assembly checkpoint protein MAD2B
MSATVFNNYQSLITAFADFLVVAIHTILYERGLYPQETFLLTRAYNFPVRQNRHPLVCKWVLDAVAAIESQLLKGTVRRVAFVIYSQQQEVLERFMFDVSSFPVVPEQERLTEFEGTEEWEGEGGEQWSMNKIDVGEQLRATIRKLAYCGGKLGHLPHDCTYTIAVELRDTAEPPIGVFDPSPPILQN